MWDECRTDSHTKSTSSVNTPRTSDCSPNPTTSLGFLPTMARFKGVKETLHRRHDMTGMLQLSKDLLELVKGNTVCRRCKYRADSRSKLVGLGFSEAHTTPACTLAVEPGTQHFLASRKSRVSFIKLLLRNTVLASKVARHIRRRKHTMDAMEGSP